MGSLLNPYISFKDTCRPAMEFYREVFGGDLTVSTFGQYGGEEYAEGADLVMHSQLTTDAGFTLMASDTPDGMEFTPGSQITISLSGDGAEADTVRDYWEKLAADGTVTMPLAEQVWGDEFGMVTDKFGIGWLVNIGASAA